jgi:hypothetical protein
MNDFSPVMYRQIGAGTLIGFGSIFILMALAYFHDLAAIAATPSLVWQFVCGIPVEDGLTGPLMMTFGAITVVAGIGAWFWPSKNPIVD